MFEKDGPTLGELLEQALSSTRAGYDSLATKFDKTPFRTPDDIAERTVSVLEAPIGAALDLCCGTGAGLLALRPKTVGRLVGVDFSAGMLEQARLRLGAGAEPPGSTRRGPTVELFQRDLFTIDFDKEFDVVTCFGAFGHVLEEQEPAFLARVRQALRPGGKFVFLSAPAPSSLDPRVWALRGFNGVMRIRNRLLSPPFIMYYLTFLLPEIARKLRWAGFRVEERAGVFEKPYQKAVVVIATRA